MNLPDPIPYEGRTFYDNFGCPTCGSLFTLPVGKDEPAPYCTHASNYAHAGNNSTREILKHQRSRGETGQNLWTQMVRVKAVPK